jgi:dTDP-L-rhamnose 4-epimerase
MVVYGEGRYRCLDHGVVRPGPRARWSLDAGDFEPPCPACGGPLTGEPVPEDHWVDPRNVYAATKLAQEHLCNAYVREHAGSSCASLRYHNVYGPRMPRDTPYAGVASIFRSAYESGTAPRVLEDGGQLRDFIHVRDVAHSNVLVLTNPEPAHGPFNICTGTPRSILDMANALRPAHPDAQVPQVVGGFRLGDIRHVFASPDRSRTELGFRPQVGFDAGMTEFAVAPLRASVAPFPHR